MKILSVDDKVENLYMLEAMLRGAGCGYEVLSAHNGVEALQKLEQDRFDLVISDILMPQMDGFELCRQVKQRDRLRHIPFIFYTATYTEKKDVEFGLRLGASRFILKPAEPEEFLAIVREVIQDYEAGRLRAAPPPAEREEVLLKAYNLRLVHKLDQKVQQLEQLNQKLQRALEAKEAELSARRKAEEAVRQARDALARANEGLEEQVARRTAQLVEANANLQTFTNTAAHDLRSPLRAIASFSGIAVAKYGDRLAPELRLWLEQVSGSAEQVQQLLDDLLEYSKMSQGELKLEPVDVRKAVREALALLEEEIRGKDAVIAVTEPLPEVLGHRATVVLVINNFLSNALKFMPPGVRPQIRIGAELVDSEKLIVDRPSVSKPFGSQPSTLNHQLVRLWVEDNGIGVAAEDQERIFGAFERLHGKGVYAGTGLGLAIVRRAVERMGGRVGVESEPGNGSRFWVELGRAG